MQSYKFNAYKPEDIDLLENITNQISVGIQNARLYEEARDRARREQLLREITARVRGSTDPDTIMRTVVREVGEALGMQTFIRMGNPKNVEKPTGPAGTGPTTASEGGKSL